MMISFLYFSSKGKYRRWVKNTKYNPRFTHIREVSCEEHYNGYKVGIIKLF